MATIGELVVKLRAESAVFTTQMDRASRVTSRTGRQIERFGNDGAKGFRKVESALVHFGLTTIGVHGRVGKFVEGLLLLGAGGSVTLGIVAGLALAGFAMGKFDQKMKKAREETKKFIDEQVKAAKLRADPNALLKEGLAGAQADAQRHRTELTRLEGRSSVQDDLDPFGLFGAKRITKVREELARADTAVANAQRSMSDSAVKLVTDMAREVAVLRLGEDAVRRLEIANSDLAPSIKAATLSLHDQKVALEAQKRAAEEAARVTERLLENQHRWRVENAGGGNLTQGAGGTNTGPIKGGLLSGATAEEITNSRAARIIAEQERNARLFEETWVNAIRGTQDAFAEFFESIGQEGFKLVSLFEGIARTIQQTFAQLLSRQIVNALFDGPLASLAPAGGGRGNRTQSQSVGSLRQEGTVVHVHQHNVLRVDAIDGPSVHRMLETHGPLFLGKIAQGISDAPALARFIVAKGSR
jgi:hypothetical protein